MQKETTVSIAIGPFASSSPFFCPIDLQLLFLMLVISRIAADQDVKRLQVALHGVVQKYSAFNSLYNTLRHAFSTTPLLIWRIDQRRWKYLNSGVTWYLGLTCLNSRSSKTRPGPHKTNCSSGASGDSKDGRRSKPDWKSIDKRN